MKILLVFAGLIAVISGCTDTSTQCSGWRSYCTSNSYVKENCKKTCNLCSTGQECIDKNNACSQWRGYCLSNSYVRSNCQRTCNLCSTGGNGNGGQQECGKPKVARGRVIGGQNAVPGSWPWQIGIFRTDGSFHCGGSLVNAKWIVTAAHCVQNQNHRYFQIVLGDHDHNRQEGTEQRLRIKQWIPHPYFNRNRGLNNDIALIELASPARFNTRVQPVCLPNLGERPAVGSKCTITGWGKIRHPGSSHPILQQLDLTVIDNSVCNRMNSKYFQIKQQMVCAANQGVRSSQSGCHGDSGGPFVCQQSDGSYKLHGAVSWGSVRCDSNDANSVFARVAEFRRWIDGYIKN